MNAAPDPPGRAGDRQQAFVVVGAGRSGTSVITRALAALDIELGDKLKPATRKNPRGFFEDRDLLEVMSRLRECAGFKRSGAGVGIVPDSALEGPAVEAIFQDAVRVIQTRFGRSPRWGFKAGGLLCFLPFWERVFATLEQDVRYVLALRNPLSVARSRQKVSRRRGQQINSDLEFLARVVPRFRQAAARPLVVVDFDRLMAGPRRELERMCRQLGLELTPARRRGIETYAGEFLSGGLRHHDLGEAELHASTQVHPLARAAYLLLAAVARDERSLADDDFWAEWTRIEREHAGLAPVLDHIDALEAELRASRQGLAGLPLRLRDLIRHPREHGAPRRADGHDGGDAGAAKRLAARSEAG